MGSLKQTFFKIDRRFGGAEPPPRAQVFLARHSLGTACVVGVFFWLLFAGVLSAFGDVWLLFQSFLCGLGMGLFVWLLCRFESRRQAHYARSGGFRWNPPEPPAKGEDRPPVWLEGLQWICVWAISTVLLWLAGQLSDPPISWQRSAVFAGVFAMMSWVARLTRERKRRRASRDGS
ncbi:hypothetical protein [Streptomyces sp. NBC_00038]|uniref:hypothetical protein n=1 Tax=Streptomyces sp. NBC_00038 TaxID=2903615 RepID=UPI00225001CF|nr:hypothetical protein [Streptomyces sp. NBC_00038]MCX5562899.1 hypothetical protein [Streptomyces sp. NBC_00038]